MDVKTTQFVRMELVLLKALVGEDRPGLFISVDRPHQYMLHLLCMHQIDHRKLTFIDAMARFATDSKQITAKVGFFRGPQNIDTLPEALKEWSSGCKDHSFDLAKCRFAVIDNLATLLNYNSQQVVRSFLMEFLTSLGENVTVPFVLDRERNPILFQMITSLGGTELRLAPGVGTRPPERLHMKIIEPQTMMEGHIDGKWQA